MMLVESIQNLATLPIPIPGKENSITKWLASYNNLIFDCDGVLWAGETMLPGVRETLIYCRKAKIPILLMTNNSSYSRLDYVDKLKRLGLEATTEEICTSGSTMADYVFKKFGAGATVVVCGEKGLLAELQDKNLNVYSLDEDELSHVIFSEEHMNEYWDKHMLPRIDAVVMGWDRKITYSKISKVCLYLQKFPDAPFLATNFDEADVVNGVRMPGAGPFVKAAEITSQRTAHLIGKPSDILVSWIKQKYNLNKDKILFFGDNLKTDIQLAKKCGIDSCLVLTGCTTIETLRQLDVQDVFPDYILPSLGYLHSQLDL